MPAIERDALGRPVYRPDGETLRQFLLDRSHVSIIQGPIGSGTSTACCMKIWILSAVEQRVGPDNVRRSRWVIVRNTFGEIKNTVIKTWLDWHPENIYGPMRWDRPYVHRIVKQLPDGVTVDLEVIFLALDQEDDVRKLRSLELTGVWFNEVEFTNKAIFDEAETRTGRFPAIKDGGSAWYGVIADMNAPQEDHWVPRIRGDIPLPAHFTEEQRSEYRKPDDWSFFVQPPGLLEIKDAQGRVLRYEDNPRAENRRWLPENYYIQRSQGKAKSWVDTKLMNRVGVTREGQPVWPMFREETHVASQPLKPDPNFPIIVGIDFGRSPAAIFGQCIRSRWFVLHEFICNEMGTPTFAPLLKSEMARVFPGFNDFTLWCDPAGNNKGETSEQTSIEIMRLHGLHVQAAPGSNILKPRLEAVETALNRNVDGYAAFLLSPECVTLKVAMAGGYHFRRLKVTGSARHADTPEKDSYSHPADALQYMILGGGEGHVMIHGQSALPEPQQTKRQYRRGDRGASLRTRRRAR